MNKKIYLYICSFFAVVAMFSVCFYISFKLYQNNNNSDVEPKQLVVQNTAAPTDNPNNSVAVDTIKEKTITSQTKYVLQKYDSNSDKVMEENLSPPADFVGLTREKLESYLEHYMSNLTVNEHLKGLISFEVVSFSDDKIVLRKTYSTNSVQYKYYIKNENDEVIVYYSDKTTVYENTGIVTSSLSEDEQVKLKIGYFIKNQQELYGILETYSS